jgi:outer membrane biosynthesis protein TonB
MRNVDKSDSRLHPLPRRREESERGFFLQSGAICLALHFILLAILTFGLRYSFPRGIRPGVYNVSISPISSPGGGTGNQAPVKPANALTPPQTTASTSEKVKGSNPVTETTSVREKKKKPNDRVSQSSEKNEPQKLKKEEPVEGLKPSRVKKEKEEKYSSDNLQEALDEIRRQAAIDRIRIRTERRGKAETKGDVGSRGDSSAKSVPQGQPTSPSAGIAGSGSGGPGIPGAGPGGPGAGTGGTGGPGSIFGFGSAGSKLDEYYATIWTQIKKEWTMPGTVITKKEDLETIVVLIIDKQGKLQKTWFEKKSGNNLYDQSTVRAIKKAEPFPPFPKELGEDSLELAIRFLPD